MEQNKFLFLLIVLGVLLLGFVISPIALLSYYVFLFILTFRVIKNKSFNVLETRLFIAQKDIEDSKKVLLKAGYMNIFLHKNDILYVEPELDDDFVELVKKKLEAKYNFGEGMNFDIVRETIDSMQDVSKEP